MGHALSMTATGGEGFGWHICTLLTVVPYCRAICHFVRPHFFRGRTAVVEVSQKVITVYFN